MINKITAVHLLKETLDTELKLGTKIVVNWDMYLEMEKEQIKGAYADGIDHDYTDLDIEFGIYDSDKRNHGEEYYNDTYNTKQ